MYQSRRILLSTLGARCFSGYEGMLSPRSGGGSSIVGGLATGKARYQTNRLSPGSIRIKLWLSPAHFPGSVRIDQHRKRVQTKRGGILRARYSSMVVAGIQTGTSEEIGFPIIPLTFIRSQKQACSRRWALWIWRERKQEPFGKGVVPVPHMFLTVSRCRAGVWIVLSCPGSKDCRITFESTTMSVPHSATSSAFDTTPVSTFNLLARYLIHYVLQPVGRCICIPVDVPVTLDDVSCFNPLVTLFGFDGYRLPLHTGGFNAHPS